jgi:hypothetical protein
MELKYNKVSCNIYTKDFQSVSSITDDGKTFITGTNTNLKINLPSALNGVKFFEFVSARIPPDIPNVNSSNNVLNLDITGFPGPIGFIIPVGFYDINTLIVALNTVLKNYNIAFLASYLSYENKINIIYNTPIAFNASSSCGELLGLTVTSLTASLTGQNVINLNAPPYLYVKSDLMKNVKFLPIKNSGITDTIIAKIPLIAEFGNQIAYTNTMSNKYVFPGKPLVSSFSISLTDPAGSIIDLVKSPWSINLIFYM